MHRPLLSKLKPESNGARRGQEAQRRGTAVANGAQAPRGRRSLNEAAHKLYR
jgi:hypothetical protein